MRDRLLVKRLQNSRLIISRRHGYDREKSTGVATGEGVERAFATTLTYNRFTASCEGCLRSASGTDPPTDPLRTKQCDSSAQLSERSVVSSPSQVNIIAPVSEESSFSDEKTIDSETSEG